MFECHPIYYHKDIHTTGSKYNNYCFYFTAFRTFLFEKVNIMFIFGQNSRIALLDPSPSGDSETENSPHEKKLGLRV